MKYAVSTSKCQGIETSGNDFLEGSGAVREGWHGEEPFRSQVGEGRGASGEKQVQRLWGQLLEGWSQWLHLSAGVWELLQDGLSNGFYLKCDGELQSFAFIFMKCLSSLEMFSLQASYFLLTWWLLCTAGGSPSDVCGHG